MSHLKIADVALIKRRAPVRVILSEDVEVFEELDAFAPQFHVLVVILHVLPVLLQTLHQVLVKRVEAHVHEGQPGDGLLVEPGQDLFDEFD